MSESDASSPTSPTLEALQSRSRDMRRARPPDITILTHENRVPLRPEKLGKRESRIGLRSIFGKSKPGKDDKSVQGTSSLREPLRPSGKRTSLADIGNWPQRLHSSRSELSLLTSPAAPLRSPAAGSTSSSRSQQSNNSITKSKLRQPTPPKTRGSITAFDPPPLFQMYPQAIKHGTLPSCVTSIDVLARFSESKNSSLQNDFSRSNLTLNQNEIGGRRNELEKKKKSKFAPEWTSKIYALVTSGYLLQYAAEGAFDRLPEKILHLTRDSAAYVSDLIPGKHWVVRVTSTTDADGNPSSDTKSFRSKLALRGVEKRQVTNMLLVFESPETMDTWLAILRREIESLGGKKKLSETGKPEADDGTAMLKAQSSQRTLVVRDPDRFSRIVSQDFSWNQENALEDPNEESSFNEPRLERRSESTVDDESSMVSSGSQRLYSLKDNGSGSSGSSGSSGNRLSFVSSGQRTIISSAESSPTTSPIRASFSSYGDDHQHSANEKPLPPIPEVRPRPNAAAIVNRRQSMQTMIPGFDPHLEVNSRMSSQIPVSSTPNQESKPQFVPNFSVPHTVGRRYSALNLSVLTSKADQPQGMDRDGPIRPFRRSPPTTLALSRPLSIVVDQPSPMSPSNSANQIPSLQAPDTPSMFGPWAPKPKPQEKTETSKDTLSEPIVEESQASSRSTTPVGNYDKDNVRVSQQSPTPSQLNTNKSWIPRPAKTFPMGLMDAPESIPRASSSFELRRSSASPTPSLGRPSTRRSTLQAENMSPQNRHSFVYPKQSSLPSIEEPRYTLTPPLTCSPKRSAPSLKALQQEATSSQFLAIGLGAKGLSPRRSMPHLAEGPPPAPPPTCALPPIPRKRSTNTVRSIRV
ncbi:uncharacterized protein F4822DRAFT_93490 [Hypoxylon trugodes]|uniref:uncharacterized protein n=1 Tax=Hypoxylon trugodes TaxID=326681 RepID=UPI00218E9B93|nr:uncharacterized protein F4822DRAFT_93490 [Hypoxylon trugodes]KAI1383131.1 hypothetical protein F4822DRAFT_93490 [Hypoxylon trugodes]